MDNQTNPANPESKVPEPPALEIDIRTMESDIKAFNEGGGDIPTEGAQESFVSQRPDEMQKQAYTGPEKPLFETPTASQAPVRQVPQQASTGTMKVILITVGIVTAIVGLGLLGYYVVFPYLFTLIG